MNDKHRIWLAIIIFAIVLVGAWLVSARSTLAAVCTNTEIFEIPLTDLGTGTYFGYGGGLYSGGTNMRSLDWESRGLTAAANVFPRSSTGTRDDTNGKIVIMSVGMSNAAQEFGGGPELDKGGSLPDSFEGQATALSNLNPKIVFVNGAQHGMTANVIIPGGTRHDTYWNEVGSRLATAGVTAAQVQVVWLKQANPCPGEPEGSCGGLPPVPGGFPTYATTLKDHMKQIISSDLVTKYPNLQQVFVSSRIYGGYSPDPGNRKLNPEPYAYESGFSVKWLVDDYINQPLARPWIDWGPYFWADGLTPRASDGLIWTCADVQNPDHGNDGVHPSTTGIHKAGGMLVDFFMSDVTTRSWFLTGIPPFPSPSSILPPPSVFPSVSPSPRPSASIIPSPGISPRPSSSTYPRPSPSSGGGSQNVFDIGLNEIIGLECNGGRFVLVNKSDTSVTVKCERR